MRSGTPVRLTLYNADDEPIKELTRLVIPWGILKRALRLAKSADMNNPTEEDVDAITALVKEVFGDNVTIKELEDGADLGEMLSVLQMIVAKAGGNMPGNVATPKNGAAEIAEAGGNMPAQPPLAE